MMLIFIKSLIVCDDVNFYKIIVCDDVDFYKIIVCDDVNFYKIKKIVMAG